VHAVHFSIKVSLVDKHKHLYNTYRQEKATKKKNKHINLPWQTSNQERGYLFRECCLPCSWEYETCVLFVLTEFKEDLYVVILNIFFLKKALFLWSASHPDRYVPKRPRILASHFGYKCIT